MPAPPPETAIWVTPLIQVLSGAATTVLGAAIGYRLTTAAEKRANKRTLEAEARAQERAADTEKQGRTRTKQAVRQQLLLVLESVRGRFEAARLHPQLVLADNDPATSVLFTKAFAHEVALALSADEARDVQQAALRAHRVAAGLVQEHQPKSVTNRAEMAEVERRVASGAQDAIQLLDKAIKTLGGPLDRSSSAPEPPS